MAYTGRLRKVKTISWQNNKLIIIDQTRLPGQLRYLCIDNLKTMFMAIKEMKIRGAPALAAAGACAVVLGIRKSKAKKYLDFKKELDKVVAHIGSSRPTAVNLFWGLERMVKQAQYNSNKPVKKIKEILLKESKAIIQEDSLICRKIAREGARLIKKGDNILTICNAGILATIDYGTALGVIYESKKQGKNIRVFACETRPLLQGARLTTWELKKMRVKVTLICDNMAASLMENKKIDKVITGADRVAANGDVANKIGTYNMAVLAKFHNIPFYVAAPLSSFDFKLKTGKDIPIEQRDKKEVLSLFFKQPIAPKNVNVINPAFDITPHNLITAIITEKGIVRPADKANIKRIVNLK
jgi:methylthioribose-1-phosphate isomerase